MFEINPGLILWTILTFIVVLLILRFTAWKTLIGALNAREDSVRSSLEGAEKARTEAERLLQENKQQLARADEQAQKVIAEGRDLGDRLKAEIIEKANAASRTLLTQAKEEITREKEKALIQLRTEVADLAIGAAGKIIDANLDAAKQKSLVDAAIAELTKSRP
jgi:F-type H+-transporting ATPase subunit b